MASAVGLRPVTEGDREFLVGVYGSTRGDELALLAWPDGAREAFVRSQFDMQDRAYRGHYPSGRFDLVEIDGVDAGRMYVDPRPTDIRLVDISLLPAFRGRGVGGNLVTRLTDEAGSTGRTVSLHVEIHHRAAALYARLGFAVVAERGLHRRMEWRGR